MKAKEYAQLIIDQPRDVLDGREWKNSQIKFSITILTNLLTEAMQKIKTTKKIETIAGVFREVLIKWKSVVSHVIAISPDHPIKVCLFGLLIAVKDIELYCELLSNNVFLGYEFCEKETNLVKEYHDKLKVKQFAENFKNNSITCLDYQKKSQLFMSLLRS